MKRLFTILAASMLAAAALDAGYVYASRSGGQAVAIATRSAAGTSRPIRTLAKPLAPDVAVEVDFNPIPRAWPISRQKSVRDQCRDWLLFAAASSLTTSAEQFGRIFFDLPAIRSGYMRPVGAFEFGPTRSRFIGDGIVLALVPAGSDAAQRLEELGRIADQQRKNLGGEFKQLLVFEYALGERRDNARLTRRPAADASYARLFSQEFGYQERTLASLDDLRRFMGTVDDLTFARKTSDSITAGGRKLATRRGAIDVEQVATVWQAERTIQKNLAEWEGLVHAQENAFNAKWEGRSYRGEAQRLQLQAEHDQEWAAVQKALEHEKARLKPVGGSGFSLDPQVDFPTLRTQFDATWPKLQKFVGTDVPGLDGAKVSAALAAHDITPLEQLKGQLNRAPSLSAMVASASLEEIQESDSFQAARYDGQLQGTEVGMTLFYTDLLAKLW